MSRLVIGFVAMSLALGGIAACDSDEGESDRCPTATYEGQINPDGKRHGERCTTDDECMYGLCYQGSSITGGDFGICTKDCGCGDVTTTCAYDDPDSGDFKYVCYYPSRSGASDTDTLAAYCVPACRGNGDADSVTTWCADHDPAYDTCETPTGVTAICTTGAE